MLTKKKKEEEEKKEKTFLACRLCKVWPCDGYYPQTIAFQYWSKKERMSRTFSIKVHGT